MLNADRGGWVFDAGFGVGHRLPRGERATSLFRFLHAADLHLDTQPSGLHGYPAEVAEVLRDASLQAFENLVDVAIDRQVSFCVFAGDIYDGAERGTRAELAFRRGLGRLAGAGIRSFVAHGNHDPVEQGWSTLSQWPEEVTVFGTGSPTTHTLELAGTTVAVHGVSYATRATTDNLALRFVRDPGADVQIGVLHTNVGDDPAHGNYAPCSLHDLRSVDLDYWALGHVHTRRVLAGADPWIVYPGNTQGRHSGASERGAKGAVVVEVEDDGTIAEPEFVPLDTVRFAEVELDATDLADPGALLDELSVLCDALRTEHPGRALVVRTTLRGRGPLHGLLADPTTMGDTLAELRSDWSGRSPVVWWDRIEDLTRPFLDPDEVARQDDFAGNTIRAIDSPLSDPDGDPGESLRTELDRLSKLSPSLRSLGVEVPPPDDPELVERARLLACDLLAEATR